MLSNKFTVLEDQPSDWLSTDSLLIGKTISFALGSEVNIMAYNWDGELLHKKENVIPGEYVDQQFVYFATAVNGEKKNTYTVYRIKTDTFSEEKLCVVETIPGSYLYFSENQVCWYQDGKDYSMNLTELKDIYLPKEVLAKENYVGLWKSVKAPDYQTVRITEHNGNTISFEICTVRGNAAQIATFEGSAQ